MRKHWFEHAPTDIVWRGADGSFLISSPNNTIDNDELDTESEYTADGIVAEYWWT